MTEPLLSVRGLVSQFATRDGIVRAVNGVSFDIEPGKVVAIVGESGSGKTATALSIARLLPFPGKTVAGSIHFNGQSLLDLDEEPMRQIRGREISMIFQDPLSGLNPVLTVGDQVAEIITSHLPVSKREAKQQAIDLMARMGLPKPQELAKQYPFQLSGGMAQRVMIAIAMALNPKLLIADEPTSALDVTVQAQILELLDKLARRRGMGLVLISHNLALVAAFCDRVAVMYGGRLMETLRASLLGHSRHPYTQGLLRCRPLIDVAQDELPTFTRDPAWAAP